MSWNLVGEAIATDAIGTPYLTLTSCSTVLATGVSGRVFLRMFGLTGRGLLIDVNANPAWAAPQEPNPVDPGLIEQGPADAPNLGYIESTPADAATATAADFRFTLHAPMTLRAAGPGAGGGGFTYYPVKSTVIPTEKVDKSLEIDGAWQDCRVRYSDPCVVELPHGNGWLVILGRSAQLMSESPEFKDQSGRSGGPSAENSVTAVVAFWAPAGDPTFSGRRVQGPYWLSSRLHERSGESVPLWKSVPAGVVVEDDGEFWLFLYYNVEYSKYPSDTSNDANRLGFQPGARFRRVRLDDLMTAISAVDPRWTAEESWEEASESWLVPGEEVGHVAVWVPTGRAFSSGSDPASDAEGNTVIEDAYDVVYVVDPAPVWTEGRLALFFAAHVYPAGSNSGPQAWGVWRAAAIPTEHTAQFGRDFVIDGNTDLSAASTLGSPDVVAADPDASTAFDVHIDPDPVQVRPGGPWAVYVGHQAQEIDPATGQLVPANQPMLQYQGTARDVAAPASAAWSAVPGLCVTRPGP